MRGLFAIVAAGLVATGTARGQVSSPPAPTPSPTTRAPAPPPSRSARPAAPATGTPAPTAPRRPRVHVPRPINGRPVASGLDGLDVPIDRRAYAVPAGRGIRQGVNSRGDVEAPVSGPPGAPSYGGRFLINRGAIDATGSPGRSVTTFTNESGGTSSILYDPSTGGATRYDYIGSVGHVYYGPRAPGTPGVQRQIPTVTTGRGLNSLSGISTTTSADAGGPFGSGYAPTAPTPAVTPASPTYSGGVYGIPANQQAPSLNTGAFP